MTAVSTYKHFCLTCICKAVIGRRVGQLLPAPISAVLDATVGTFYCKTSVSHDWWKKPFIYAVQNKKNTFLPISGGGKQKYLGGSSCGLMWSPHKTFDEYVSCI